VDPTGAALFAYNWGLELVTARLDQRKAGEDVEVPWTLAELRREWNRAKDEAAPWWAQNSKEAYNSGLDALARALRNWSDSRSGRRKGRPVGFPRRKKKRRARVACRSPLDRSRCSPTASTYSSHRRSARIGGLTSTVRLRGQVTGA
jgi:putative transposase